jgi:geranylgeranyl pyrophosphate synthase
VVRIVRNSSGIEASYGYAQTFAKRAREQLEAFPISPYREALESLTHYVVRRRH